MAVVGARLGEVHRDHERAAAHGLVGALCGRRQGQGEDGCDGQPVQSGAVKLEHGTVVFTAQAGRTYALRLQ